MFARILQGATVMCWWPGGAAWPGVAALLRWLVEEYAGKIDLTAVRLGPGGIARQILLGTRESDAETRYLSHFIELARQLPSAPKEFTP